MDTSFRLRKPVSGSHVVVVFLFLFLLFSPLLGRVEGANLGDASSRTVHFIEMDKGMARQRRFMSECLVIISWTCPGPAWVVHFIDSFLVFSFDLRGLRWISSTFFFCFFSFPFFKDYFKCSNFPSVDLRELLP